MGVDKETETHRLEDPDIVAGDDGYYVFWPSPHRGALNAKSLRRIAGELDRRNAAWDRKSQEGLGGER